MSDDHQDNEVREFVICSKTMKAFEIEAGKIFVEYRGEPPQNPIHVIEKASLLEWELNKEIEIHANSDKSWNQLMEERDFCKDLARDMKRELMKHTCEPNQPCSWCKIIDKTMGFI